MFNYSLSSSLYKGLFIAILFKGIGAEGFCASEASKELKASYLNMEPLLQSKAKYFFSNDPAMRKTYDNNGLDFQVSSAYPVMNFPEKYGLERADSAQPLDVFETEVLCVSEPVQATQELDTFKTEWYFGVNDVQEPLKEASVSCLKIAPLIEFKAGYFFFEDSTLRKVYDKGGIDLQLSGSYPLRRWSDRYGIDLYGSVEYLRCSGEILNIPGKTVIWELPVNFGLKPVIAITSQIQYYAAIGPRYVYVHQCNDSLYLSRIVSRSGMGMFVNTGFNFAPCRHLVIDIFGEYSYVQMHFPSTKNNVYGATVQVGGFTFGGGLGYAF